VAVERPALDLRTIGTLVKPQAIVRTAGEATCVLDLRDEG